MRVDLALNLFPMRAVPVSRPCPGIALEHELPVHFMNERSRFITHEFFSFPERIANRWIVSAMHAAPMPMYIECSHVASAARQKENVPSPPSDAVVSALLHHFHPLIDLSFYAARYVVERR